MHLLAPKMCSREYGVLTQVNSNECKADDLLIVITKHDTCAWFASRHMCMRKKVRHCFVISIIA